MSESEEDNDEIPARISLRLDQATREAVEAVMRTSGLKASSAIRMLITLGAAREGQLEPAFKAAAWRDTAMRTSASIQKKFKEMVAKVFAELPDPAE